MLADTIRQDEQLHRFAVCTGVHLHSPVYTDYFLHFSLNVVKGFFLCLLVDGFTHISPIAGFLNLGRESRRMTLIILF